MGAEKAEWRNHFDKESLRYMKAPLNGLANDP